jgi:hypothetical protein
MALDRLPHGRSSILADLHEHTGKLFLNYESHSDTYCVRVSNINGQIELMLDLLVKAAE